MLRNNLRTLKCNYYLSYKLQLNLKDRRAQSLCVCAAADKLIMQPVYKSPEELLCTRYNNTTYAPFFHRHPLVLHAV